MTESLISVIMAVRNGERFLRDAIDSVRAQAYRPLEIVFIDGQSTDGTAAIARSYPDIRYIPQETLGVANAYNLGVQSSRGELMAFLSHDDTWPPEKLTLQASYLSGHPEVEAVVAHVKFFLEPGCAFPSTLRESISRPRRIWIGLPGPSIWGSRSPSWTRCCCTNAFTIGILRYTPPRICKACSICCGALRHGSAKRNNPMNPARSDRRPAERIPNNGRPRCAS
jgi:glycosyltransferase involved in cell wall biosynthesis